jgi:hypothetical protein
MSVGFRAAGSVAAGNNSATLAPGLPSGWQPGDLHVAVCHVRLRTATVTMPAGWDLQGSYQHSDATNGLSRVYIFTRVAQTGDTAPTVTFANGATSNTVRAVIVLSRISARLRRSLRQKLTA